MIKVDNEKCIGCGACAAVCEKVFEMDFEKMKAKVISQEKCECVKEAINACPTEAISE